MRRRWMPALMLVILSAIAACATTGKISPIRARAQLEEMNIPYEGYEFVDRAGRGDIQGVALFLSASMSPDAIDKLDYSPLRIATSHGYTGIVKLLLTYGAIVNATNIDGLTPLLCAASKGHNKTVKLLLKAGADPDAADNSGATVLMHAASKSHA